MADAPELWNNLPLDLRCTSNVRVFKRNLKTHLFKKAFSDEISIHSCNFDYIVLYFIYWKYIALLL